MPLPKNNLLFGFANKLTNEQRVYVDAIFDNQMIAVDAKAGTGKTTLAVAASRVMEAELVYIFSPVEEGKMGFRPGTQEDKELAYIQPLVDALLEINENPAQVICSEENIDNLKNGNVWVFPKSHIFARGTNLKGTSERPKVIIIDEAQNFTKSELKKVLTRIHDAFTTVILIGHDGQIDLENPRDSGFRRVIDHFKDEPYVAICQLTINFRGKLAQKADDL
jgi:predicted ribonuclease YlaK